MAPTANNGAITAATTTTFPITTQGTTVITWTYDDGIGNTSTQTQNVIIDDNTAPDIAGVPSGAIIQGNDPGLCGAMVDFPVITAVDNCSGNVTLSMNHSSGSIFPVGITTVTVTASDAFGNSITESFDVIVTNEIPVIEAISAPMDPVQVGTIITTSASFTDNNLSDVSWEWGDGISSIGVIDGQTITGTHEYQITGVYAVNLIITDHCGETVMDIYQYVVIYDPEGGFVTGGGWINSPLGAYTDDPLLYGKANFGFVSKYKKDATVPTGNTEFQFKAGDLEFNSYLYDWLVIAGPQAKFKGEGHINGMGSYGFMLSAVDGQVNGGGGLDKFRIKIWDMITEAVVYDNNLGLSEEENATTVIGGGSIVIHSDKKNSARIASSSTLELEEISDIENMNFNVYPNPVTDVVTIELTDKFKDHNAKMDVHLFNLTGIDILKDSHMNMDMNNLMIDMRSHPPGIYLLIIQGDKEIVKYKLIKL